MDENTADDPMSFLKWPNKSAYTIAEELNLRGHKISAETVRLLLKERDYSLQANVKTKEGGSVAERDAQFRYMKRLSNLLAQLRQRKVSKWLPVRIRENMKAE